MSRQKLFRCGALIDGTTPKPKEDGLILVEGERIVAAGSKEDVHATNDADEVELSGYSVMPGLIDCHVHLASDSSGSGMNPELWELKTPFSLKVFHAVNNARKTIEGGFTTIRNMGHQWTYDPPWDAELRNAINQGLLPGPRVLASVNIIGMTSSHGDIFLPSHYPMRPIRIADGAGECRIAVRENVRAGADFIKIMASGGGVLGWGDKPEWRNYTQEEIRSIVDEAHSFGKKVAAHAVGVQGIRNAVACDVDSIEHGYQIDEEAIIQMKKRSLTLVPTLMAVHSILTVGSKLGLPEEQIDRVRQMEADYIKNLKFARKVGLRIALGTDIAGTWALHGKNARELSLRVELLGMTPFEAIESGTRVAAEALGLTDTGTLVARNRADFIAIEGNPLDNVKILEDRSRITMVVRGGEIVSDRRVT